ncbi:MAG TPA: serine protease [Mycobacteriales bacterium]|nr:serine protease [Mycobacteriales bacterium]
MRAPSLGPRKCRRRRAPLTVTAAAVVLAGCTHGSTPKTSGPPPDAKVGALFVGGLQGLHVCTASVVHSSTGDVIATAAHCLTGRAVGTVFAPGYGPGGAPYGTWTVTGAYVESAWIHGRDPHADIAFLTVAAASTNRSGSAPVEHVVGASTLATAPADGTPVTATGYALGSHDRPLSCSAATTTTDGYPTLPCGPLPLGTSGAPWIATADDGTPQLVGVVGGLHQGGCTPDVSYSAPFTATTAALLARAEDGGPADALPARGDDGC